MARRLGLVSGVRPWGACPLALSLLALLPSVFLHWLLAVLFTEGMKPRSLPVLRAPVRLASGPSPDSEERG